MFRKIEEIYKVSGNINFYNDELYGIWFIIFMFSGEYKIIVFVFFFYKMRLLRLLCL